MTRSTHELLIRNKKARSTVVLTNESTVQIYKVLLEQENDDVKHTSSLSSRRCWRTFTIRGGRQMSFDRLLLVRRSRIWSKTSLLSLKNAFLPSPTYPVRLLTYLKKDAAKKSEQRE